MFFGKALLFGAFANILEIFFVNKIMFNSQTLAQKNRRVIEYDFAMFETSNKYGLETKTS